MQRCAIHSLLTFSPCTCLFDPPRQASYEVQTFEHSILILVEYSHMGEDSPSRGLQNATKVEDFASGRLYPVVLLLPGTAMLRPPAQQISARSARGLDGTWSFESARTLHLHPTES